MGVNAGVAYGADHASIKFHWNVSPLAVEIHVRKSEVDKMEKVLSILASD